MLKNKNQPLCFGIYIANSTKNFQNNVILSLCEISKQKGLFLCYIHSIRAFERYLNKLFQICYTRSKLSTMDRAPVFGDTYRYGRQFPFSRLFIRRYSLGMMMKSLRVARYKITEKNILVI